MTSFLVGWPGGSLESALKLLALILVAYALVLWLSAIIWVYRDVKNRTNDQTSQLIAVVLVAVFNLPGLIVYLVIRPQATLADAYEQSLEAEAILHELQMSASSCQNCRRPIDEDFNVCPNCRAILREPCRACGKLVRTNWVICPYCATDRSPARPVQQPQGQTLSAPAQGARPATPSGTEPLTPPQRARPTQQPPVGR